MWTVENRGRYDRSGLRYPSDPTDDEGRLVEPLIPPAKKGGNKRSVDVRKVVNGLAYILSTGCQWRARPKDLAPRSTAYDYFARWDWDGTWARIHEVLYRACRAQGRLCSGLTRFCSSCMPMAAARGRNRRALAFLRLAFIRLMLRKL